MKNLFICLTILLSISSYSAEFDGVNYPLVRVNRTFNITSALNIFSSPNRISKEELKKSYPEVSAILQRCEVVESNGGFCDESLSEKEEELLINVAKNIMDEYLASLGSGN